VIRDRPFFYLTCFDVLRGVVFCFNIKIDTSNYLVFTKDSTSGYKGLFQDSALKYDATNIRLFADEIKCEEIYFNDTVNLTVKIKATLGDDLRSSLVRIAFFSAEESFTECHCPKLQLRGRLNDWFDLKAKIVKTCDYFADEKTYYFHRSTSHLNLRSVHRVGRGMHHFH